MINLDGLQATSAAILFVAAMAAPTAARADQVFNDDVIITGSLCVGFDCVSGMTFGSDTIVLQENNSRIFFNDTSTSSGFPANDWRLIANDTTSGGANYFAIEDATAGRQLFRVTAGAPSNSIFVASTGKVGFRTTTPVLDLHVRTGDTPGLRLEQDGSGGFSPQTWDIAGNESNFFVRDVTSGSRLPFRIRPGAPTSSIDIASNGNVGLGVINAPAKLTMVGPADQSQLRILRDTSHGSSLMSFAATGDLFAASNGFFDGSNWQRFDTTSSLWFAALQGGSSDKFSISRFPAGGNPATGNTAFLVVDNTGRLGLGATSPSAQLHTTGTVRFAGVANCGSGIQTDASGNLSCIVSSQRFKNIAGALPYHVALANVMALRPEYGAYKKTPTVPEHWLIAEDVAKVDPALAGFANGKPYTVKTQNVVADLVAVVQHQQRQIDELKQTLADNAKH